MSRFIIKNFRVYPNNLKHYSAALIHSSVQRKDYINNFERLEYLGDSVIELAVREYLLNKYPTGDEGYLTKMKSALVNRKTLNSIASNININEVLEADYQSMNAFQFIYGNALEAFFGALFLDLGYPKTKKALYYLFENQLNLSTLIIEDQNYKGQIIEWAQKKKFTWRYETVANLDTLVDAEFISILFINDEKIAEGFGNSKKNAEQNASEIALEKIEDEIIPPTAEL